jgi:multicomponent Na+:H+ antiporter subunit G
VISFLAAVLIVLGLFFFAGGSVGILRFPDFYSRLHPAGKLDTMGLLLSLTGIALYVVQDLTLSAILTALKIMLIVVFVFITSPTATHAILDAGVRAGLSPWTAPGKRGRK